MASYHYSGKTEGKCAKAVGLALPISGKISMEVCRVIRGKPLARAKFYLGEVAKKKEAVPMVRYFQEVAHKPGMAVGKYPVKCVTHILQILESAEANARTQGLDIPSLVVAHAVSQRGHTARHYGRLGREAKRTHIEIILREAEKDAKESKPAKKAAPAKKEQPKKGSQ